MSHSLKKMTLTGLILMIFTSVFGFANSPSAFYLMGYSATPFYIVSALFFFIPFALMMAEMGSAYRKEEGGIYSWMNNSVGPRLRVYRYVHVVFILRRLDGQHGGQGVGAVFHASSAAADQTQVWALAGLTLHAGWSAFWRCAGWCWCTPGGLPTGINKIARITAVGGISVMCLNLVLLLVSIAILCAERRALRTGSQLRFIA